MMLRSKRHDTLSRLLIFLNNRVNKYNTNKNIRRSLTMKVKKKALKSFILSELVVLIIICCTAVASATTTVEINKLRDTAKVEKRLAKESRDSLDRYKKADNQKDAEIKRQLETIQNEMGKKIESENEMKVKSKKDSERIKYLEGELEKK